MEILPPELMELIFLWANPRVIEQFKATSKYYNQIFSKNRYIIHAPTIAELDEIVSCLITKASDEHISFTIKKPTMRLADKIAEVIPKISEISNITSLNISALTLLDSSITHLVALKNLQELDVKVITAKGYDYLTSLGNLTKLTLHEGEASPHLFETMTNLRELNLLSTFLINGPLQGLKNPSLLTRLHISKDVINYSLWYQWNEIGFMNNLEDLQLDYKSLPYNHQAHQPYDFPLTTTKLHNLSTSIPIKPNLIAANAHLTRLVLHLKINTQNFHELAKLTRLQELSIIVSPHYPLQTFSLKFLEQLEIRSLTVLTATSDYQFLEYIREDSLKELKIDILTACTSLERLNRLTALESLEIAFNHRARSVARYMTVSNLTRLTRLVTPRDFQVLQLNCLTGLLELSTGSEIDNQVLQGPQKLTKLVVLSKYPLGDNLPTSLQKFAGQNDPPTLHTLTNLTRLELVSANTCSWALMLTKLKKLEIMNFVTNAKLNLVSALTNLTYLSIGSSEDFPSDGHPFVLLTKLQVLQLIAVSDNKLLQIIEAKLPRLIARIDSDIL